MKRYVKRLMYRLGYNLYCPVCDNYARKFESFGRHNRSNARCPACGALERHRLIWYFLKHHTDLFDGQPKKMLHIAPEPAFIKKLKKIHNLDHITADISDPNVTIQMDITDIQFPDNTFDVIYCSHVLEHVPDDRKALKEFYRVLKNDCWALLLVPIAPKDKTFEDPTITDPKDRERMFGQHDHIRMYGRDYIDRLKEAGFHVEHSTALDLAGSHGVKMMALTDTYGSDIYYCIKRGNITDSAGSEIT
jgi:SAM-dependent methyltransferase